MDTSAFNLIFSFAKNRFRVRLIEDVALRNRKDEIRSENNDWI